MTRAPKSSRNRAQTRGCTECRMCCDGADRLEHHHICA
eukprot:CAMPEP_0119380602 /NCGR_PEP_ID=MMETSP1334-20130426/57737_1 /TAXON_ID=127549 /ORGANISM="Calcidiscus leptoporus, Strain RCC1130" /LENGTH=37 /DNA_ID= /DNA_START= /DNA_END= /DNA_ORIENTATION=